MYTSHIRQPYSRPDLPKRKVNQTGIVKPSIFGLIIFVLLFGVFEFVSNHTSAASVEIKSGVFGYCLDDYRDKTIAGNVVDSWGCNGTSAQDWALGATTIRHGNNACLALSGKNIVSEPCSNSASEVWLSYLSGFQNPDSGLCLSIPGNTGVQLVAATCNDPSSDDQTWTPTSLDGQKLTDSCNTGTEGARVACYAEREWTTWESGSPNHNLLLNNYTDGNAYEEWCADFVSYVYKEAGYPFSQGERDNWDEYDANNIQYMNFTYHSAGNYTPKPGDVAFFNYPGGHVEIVVSGGSKPTFIYGDSATTDPTTGNGQMEANTISSQSEGEVVYYLSPN